MVVGAAEKGYAYIFKKDNTNNWVQIKVIAKASINFGVSVAISGDYIVVGAKHAKNGSITFVGAAFVFKKDIGGTDNWGEIKQIVASDREYNDLFGASVAISGDYIVVGAPWEDPLKANGSYQSDAGSAYVFKKDQGGTDNWGQIKKIVASDRAVLDYFGYSVAISGDYIVVGASGEDHDASGGNILTDAGSAYVFEFVPPVITGPNSNTGPSSSISIYENTATVHTFSADQTVSWSLGSANDEALLSINSNGNLVFTSAPDYETPLSKSNSNTYIVAVIATDQYNTSATQTLTITVLDFPNTNFGSFDSITKYYFSGSSTIIAPTTNNSNQIIYTSDNAAIATVSGSVITFTGVGTANITATQAADANHEGNAVSSVLTVLGRVTKYGGLASTDMNYVYANGKVGGAFGIDQYGRRINISYVNYGLSSSTAGLYKTTYTGY